METFRIFISSPGDVAEERALAWRVIDRLQGEFAGRLFLEPVFWEHEPLLATSGFQEQIVRPSGADAVVSILWSRLGTRLPPGFTRADGSRYASGTEFEFEDAARASRETGRPELLVYRKTVEPRVALRNREALMERLRQREALDEFVGRWFHDQADGSLKAAFHPFESPGEFETVLETHLRKLVERRLPEIAAGERPPATWKDGSPFRGLEAFDVEHAPVFFGRTRAVTEVLEALRRQAADGRPFVMVLGGSGSGKSSLVKAGVLPLLTQPGVIEGVAHWRWAVMRPGESRQDLQLGLATALLRAEAVPELDPDDEGPGPLAEMLRDSPAAALRLLSTTLSNAARTVVEAAEGAGPPAAHLALVLDQFEEIFADDHFDDAERERFLATIDSLVRGGRAWVIATLRSDFYPRCAELDTLTALKRGDGQLDLPPPSPAEIGQMIRQPALAAGLRFEHHPDTDETLHQTLRDAAARNAGALPLLEFALEELYRRRDERDILTFAEYDRLGGVEGAIGRRAEEVFDSLEPPVREALPAVLRQLVQIGPHGDGAAISRRASLVAATATPHSRRLVDAFVDARLLVTGLADDGEPTVRVAHEALLANWPRLADWVHDNRELLRLQQRLTTAAQRWQEGGRAPDFLLQVGRPLEEGRQVVDQLGDEVPVLERAFVAAGIARERRLLLLRRGVTATLAGLAAIAAVTALLALAARRDADARRGQAEDLVGFMLGDLRQTLDSVGRLDAMSGANQKVLDYFASLPADELTDDVIARRAEALRQIGEVRMQQGSLEDAAEAFREAAQQAEGLARRDPSNGDWQAAYADSRFWLGYVLFELERFAEAGEEFETHRDVYEKLTAGSPDRVDWRLELAYAHTNLGDVAVAGGDREAALRHHRYSLDIIRTLADADPQNPDLQLDLATGYNRVGSALEAQGELEAALESYRADLEIVRRLLEADPQDADRRERLATAFGHVGSVAVALGDLATGLRIYRAEVTTGQALVELDPDNTRWLGNLADAYDRLGKLLSSTGDLDGAHQAYGASFEIVDRLAGDEPENTAARRELADRYRKLGEVLTRQGNLVRARRMVSSALEILDDLVAEHPEAETYRRLSQALLLQARLLERQGDSGSARATRQRALEAIEPHSRTSSDSRYLFAWLQALLDLDRVEEATPVARRLREQGFSEPAFVELCRRYGLLVDD